MESCTCACHHLGEDAGESLFRVRFLAGASEGGPIDAVVQGCADWSIRKFREHLFKACIGGSKDRTDESSPGNHFKENSCSHTSSCAQNHSARFHSVTASVSVSMTQTGSAHSQKTVPQVSLNVSASAFDKLDIYFNGRLIRDNESLGEIVSQCFACHRIPEIRLAGHVFGGGNNRMKLPKCLELPVICAKHDPCRCKKCKRKLENLIRMHNKLIWKSCVDQFDRNVSCAKHSCHQNDVSISKKHHCKNHVGTLENERSSVIENSDSEHSSLIDDSKEEREGWCEEENVSSGINGLEDVSSKIASGTVSSILDCSDFDLDGEYEEVDLDFQFSEILKEAKVYEQKMRDKKSSRKKPKSKLKN